MSTSCVLACRAACWSVPPSVAGSHALASLPNADRAAKDEYSEASGRAKTGLAAMKLGDLAIDPSLARKAAQAVEEYAGAAGQAASFVEEDAFNATMFMTDAEQKFAAAQQRAGQRPSRRVDQSWFCHRLARWCRLARWLRVICPHGLPPR